MKKLLAQYHWQEVIISAMSVNKLERMLTSTTYFRKIIVCFFVLGLERVCSGVGTGGSGGSMNRGPELLGPPSSGARKILGKTLRKIIKIAKMHQIRFRLELRPRSRWGSLQRTPDPLAGFGGGALGGRERGWAGEEEGKGRERGGRGSGGEGKGGPQITVEPGPLRALLRAERHVILH